MKDRYDVVIVGGGSAGFSAAIRAVELGGTVAMVNDGLPLGGTCVNVGCVPSKYLIRAAETLWRPRAGYFPGMAAQTPADLSQLFDGLRKTVEKLRREKYEDLLQYYDIHYVEGRALLSSPRTVRVGGREIQGDKIIIATGSRPIVPKVEGLDSVRWYTNETFFLDSGIPRSIAFIGGGTIAVELGQALNRLGVEVHIVSRSGRLLGHEEEIAGRFIEGVLAREGVNIVRGEVARVERVGGGAQVRIGGVGTIAVDAVFVAVGRRPNSEAAAGIGVELRDDGGIKVNERMETNIPNVYAAGDVTGGVQLYGGRYAENAAARQGFVAATNAMGGNARYVPETVPRVTFTDPPIASVGLREEDMISGGIGCVCRAVPISLVAAAWVSGATEGFVKVNTYPETWRVSVKRGRIAGGVIAAPHAEELIHVLSLAVAQGLTVDDLVDMVPSFPSFGEALRLALLAFYKDVTKLSCCSG